MKHSEIDAMQPGPELDALVAEKVMGDPIHTDHGEIGEDSAGRPFCSRCDESGDWSDVIFSTDACPPKPYSTSDAAALEVLKKLRERLGGVVKVVLWSGGWSVEATEPSSEYIGIGTTLGEAACRAALKAVR